MISLKIADIIVTFNFLSFVEAEMSKNNQISLNDFMKVDIRVGTISKAASFPESKKPAIKIWVDFGEHLGARKSSAQLTTHYSPDELEGRQVAAVVNLPPLQIGKFMSEVLILGFPDENGDVVLIQPESKLPNGGKLF